jgi:hypothetical protein
MKVSTMSEKELVDTFMSMMYEPYYEKVIWSISSNLADLVTIEKHVEDDIKSEKIQGATSAQAGVKKFFGSPLKKKKGETNAISVGSSRRPPIQLPYLQYPYVASMAQGQYQQPAHSGTNLVLKAILRGRWFVMTGTSAI